MFDPKSRYAKQPTYTVTDHRGRQVQVVAVPPAPGERVLGFHLRKQGERLDLLAALYLKDPAAFWRIAEVNGVALAEALTEAREVAIPGGK
jgi:hypothetical protein